MFAFPDHESLTVEFKSDPPSGLSNKTIVDAVDGLANTEGGDLYIGIDDNGTVTGLHSELWSDSIRAAAYIANNTVPPVLVRALLIPAGNDKKVMILNVPKSPHLVSTRDGRTLRRRLKIDRTPENVPLYMTELWPNYLGAKAMDFTGRVLPDSTYDDLDSSERERLRDMVRTFQGDPSLLTLSNEELEKALGLVVEEDGLLKPTVSGLLLIGKKERLAKLLPSSKVTLQILEGTNVRRNETFCLPLLAAFEKITDAFLNQNQETEFTDGLIRVPVPDYSEKAFREALVNAFAHRTYIGTDGVGILFSDLGLQITSPGDFLDGISLENLLTAQPRSRNPQLADILKRIGLAEKTGRGIDRIFEEALIMGRPLPDFSESTSAYVRILLPKKKANIEFYKRIIEYRKKFRKTPSLPGLWIMAILEKASVSRSTLLKEIPFSKTVIDLAIEDLLDEDMIVRVNKTDDLLSEPFYGLCGKEYVLPQSVPETSSTLGDSAFNQEKVRQFALDGKEFSRSDVESLLGINPQRTYLLLKRMVDKGILEKIGERKYTRYRMVDHPKD